MEGKHSYLYREILPFAAMVIVECTYVGLNTLFKAASNKGMGYRVFLVYSYALSALCLAPVALLFHRKAALPPLSISILARIVLLAVLGFSAQYLGYIGMNYSSPTLSSAMSNLTPAFTFGLALVFRMEKLRIKRASSQAKILGTLVSISGALVVVLYKGSVVIRAKSASGPLNQSLISTPQSDWDMGGLLLAAQYLLLSMWYIVQAQTMRMYPAELLVVFYLNIASTVVAAPICYLGEPNLSAWRISTKLMLVAVIYSAVAVSSFGIAVHSWGLRVKGPVYIALFKPLSIAIAVIMGVIFLGDTLHLGSIVGAILISIGFYVVIWGKSKEETSLDLDESNSEPSSADDAPILKPLLADNAPGLNA